MRNCFNQTKISDGSACISILRISSLQSLFEISGKLSIKKRGLERDFLTVLPFKLCLNKGQIFNCNAIYENNAIRTLNIVKDPVDPGIIILHKAERYGRQTKS